MAANVESMFYTRTAPWHGLGTRVAEALSSKEALQVAGLDWKVRAQEIYTEDGIKITGMKANVRDKDQKILGVVTDKYQIVQNEEAFAFTDELLGYGVRYETAGSLQDGKRTWMLAKLPEEYRLVGDEVIPYLVFSNSHDGSGAIKVALTPVRVVCQNTLNLALATAPRSWTTIHVGDMSTKMEDATRTLFQARYYMMSLEKEAENLSMIKMSDGQVEDMIESLLPLKKDGTPIQDKNIQRLREDMRRRYHDAPDLDGMGKNGYRFLNAVSDFATHGRPLREARNFKEALFARTMDGGTIMDRAYQMVLQVA